MDTEFDELFQRLKRPFPTSAISWRIGASNAKSVKDGEPIKGIPLAYIDARDVMDRLDDVMGPEHWQDRYTATGEKTVCSIGLRVGGEWIWKEDGAGDTDTEAEKGALSDAFKRAAVRWGIGRYLYGLKAKWIEVEKRGTTLIIPDSSRKQLDDIHDEYIKGIEWGDREDRYTYRLAIAAIQRLDAHMLTEFEEAAKPILPNLPVAVKHNLLQKIEQLGRRAGAKEAA